MKSEKKIVSAVPGFVFSHRRKLIAIIALASLSLMSLGRQPDFQWGGYREIIVAAGWILVLTGVAVRFWAALYIAGNRDKMLQTNGPYGLVRNPLYLGNLLSAAGIGILSASFSAALFLLLGISFVFYETIEYEDQKLLGIFGKEFTLYRRRVPRLLPHIRDIRHIPLNSAGTQRISYANFGSELRSARGVIFAALLVHVYAVLIQTQQLF